ncbi:MAG TPA: penicillin-binding protein 2 [Candidatus Lachnoclostridium pullistercoris]|uniref:Penicillin-binding protein 2 n=1 Tax=Candidatus Lachnoclostridium pullistercoris TaxID=2838632 RepID=A0A9D2PCS8_9FIRM|nr:penicillin-binding protein 2 [Candidatus Lachnoclostridium pullistercoris]
MKKNVPNPKANKNILRLAYAVAGVFVCMVLYLGYFLQFESDSVINNAYNPRVDLLAERVVRGEIRSADGQVLARTVTDADGTERREYPFGQLYAHAVGYTGNGKTGIESLTNFYLLTSHVNLAEQVINQFSGIKNLGDDVVTTLDSTLQQTAWELLGDRRGAVAVMEPDTGKILAMVSKPDYDPNTIAADWETLTADEGGEARLLNRVTQGLYPPGSTFKILTLLEYLREHPQDYDQFHFDCDGVYEQGDYTIRCYHGEAHGSQNLAQAFANSCNGAFAQIGMSLDKEKFRSLAEELLYNQELPLSLPYSESSFSLTKDADDWETLQTAIGQGKTQTTPMHTLMITSAIANGGTLMKPYLVDRLENAGGQEVKKFLPSSWGELMTAEEAGRLAEFMRQVVTEGTGSALRTDAYTAAGKTGSAEFETGKETHAWFTGFAPAEDPEIAVVVLVEEGGSGGKAAAPIARGIFDAYFSGRSDS